MPKTVTGSVAAIIVGAGQGRRANPGAQGMPKQFHEIAGKTIFQHTLDPFFQVEDIAHIVCVVPEKNAPDRLLPRDTENLHHNRLSVVTGGQTRQQSVLKGLRALQELKQDWAYVLVHDAARPFASPHLIQAVIRDVTHHGASIAALPAVDSLKQAALDEAGALFIDKALQRSGAYLAQTPQGFSCSALLKAHEIAAKENRHGFLDDAELYQAYAGPVAITHGERDNWKITTKEDLMAAETLLNRRHNFQPDIRVGHGYDVHGFTSGDHVILCGVHIPYSHSLQGHSDADVGLHALTDAILGALADGDIGQHFPPQAQQWKDASSDQFLHHACRLAAQQGARITHMDVTLVCEEPKIGPYRQEMRTRLADITDLDAKRISVKATTTEGLGFTGRKQGIAAYATATLCFAGE